VSWFITKGVDRKARRELERIRKALERLADVAELHFGSRSGPSLRSFYKDKNPKAIDEAELAYVDDEEAWVIEQAERSGISIEAYREMQSYATGETEGEVQAEDVKR
jgi:hypothetical protein